MKKANDASGAGADPIVSGPPPSAPMTRRQALGAGVGAVALAGFTPGLAGAGLPVAPDQQPVPRSGGRVPRSEVSFDEGWLFHRGDAAGAEVTSFDDGGWRVLDLPHDWQIEDLPYASSDDGGATADPSAFAYEAKPWPQGVPPAVIGPFDANADTKPDLEIPKSPVGPLVFPGGRGQGYTVGGLGWYRKRFQTPIVAQDGGPGQRVELRFDGVYRNADIWLNGQHLGFHPNGYTSFAYDLTPHLVAKGDNVLAVRVDNRGKSTRWYSGSGIYRHTWLTITGPVRVPLWGVHVTTPQADQHRSTVRVEAEVSNAGPSAELRVRTTLHDPQGRPVAIQTTPPQPTPAGAAAHFTTELTVTEALLWSPETPHLYSALTEILAGDAVVDAVATTFGIRSLAFDGAAGLLLNGKPIKIHGGNIHHDHGPLGAVAIDRAEERTIEILKAAGFNAIRASHNPRSPYMLDVCDRLGMLVYNEFTDMWDVAKMADDYHLFFPQWWERDLGGMVVRDRNHPSVIIWSIGNEIAADPNKYGPRLAALVRSLDTTRPVTLGGMNVGSFKDDAFKYTDIADYHGGPPPSDRAAHPDKVFLQSEDISAQIFHDSTHEANAWYAGTWIWSAWDYLGEPAGGATTIAKSKNAAPGVGLAALTGKVPYPWFSNFQSDIDLIGQRKPQNLLRAVVNGISQLEMMVARPTPPGTQQYDVWYAYYDELPSWTWNVPPGQVMTVHVYTSGDSVTLTLNGKPVASQTVTEANQRLVVFNVPYAPGALTAIASHNGAVIARTTLTTAGKAAALRLTSDVGALTTSRGALAHVLVEVIDARGQVVPDAVLKVSFGVDGAGELVGVGNGNPHNVDSFKRPRRWTWHGKALAILRPAKQPGRLTLTATADGLQGALLNIPIALSQ
jgi:beta-galactosidase